MENNKWITSSGRRKKSLIQFHKNSLVLLIVKLRVIVIKLHLCKTRITRNRKNWNHQLIFLLLLTVMEIVLFISIKMPPKYGYNLFNQLY